MPDLKKKKRNLVIGDILVSKVYIVKYIMKSFLLL